MGALAATLVAISACGIDREERDAELAKAANGKTGGTTGGTTTPDEPAPTPVDAGVTDSGVDPAPEESEEPADSGIAVDGGIDDDPIDGGITDGGLVDGGVDVPVFTPAGIAAIHSDRTVVSLSILDANGSLVNDDCLNSSSATEGGLTAALSGDVVFPSNQTLPGSLLLLDRTNTNVVFVNPADCSVTNQVSVYVNPQDVVVKGSDKMYVTQYSANPAPTPEVADFDDGADILIVNPETDAIVGRIDLNPFAASDLDGMPLPPRPTRMVLDGDLLYVTLQNISSDFSFYGDTKIAVVDTNTDTVVEILDMPTTARNCSELVVKDGYLFAACVGAWSAGQQQIDESAIARVNLATKIIEVFPAAPFARPAAQSSLAVVTATQGFAITIGEFTDDNPLTDTLWSWDFANPAAPVNLFAADASFTLGTILVDPVNGTVFVSDAGAAGGMRVLTSGVDGALTLGATVATSPTRMLPVRGLSWF